MLFQTIDDKGECIGYYVDGHLVFDTIPENLTATWKYTKHLEGLNVDFASLYCGGQSIDEACPSELREEWQEVNKKLKAFYRSLRLAKIDLNQSCFFDLVPKQFLLEYLDIKNRITKHALEAHKRPENYDFLASLSKVAHEIRFQKLNVDASKLNDRMSEFKVRQFRTKLKNTRPYIDYDIFGTKTGRLTTRKNSFPILTMNKDYRDVLRPQNEWFVELDFNAAELRTLLALLGEAQPQEDMHEWNLQNVYCGIGTREKAKERIFAWLYNPSSRDHLADRKYNRKLIKDKYWNGSHIINPFGRLIESDEFHSVNYLVQSTASDIF
jgi:hypothetical protein